MDTLNPMSQVPQRPHLALTVRGTEMEHFASLSPDRQRQLIDPALDISPRRGAGALYPRHYRRTARFLGPFPPRTATSAPLLHSVERGGERMAESGGPSGELLVAAAALAAVQLAQGRGTSEIDTLAAFFTVLGDNLALLSVRRVEDET